MLGESTSVSSLSGGVNDLQSSSNAILSRFKQMAENKQKITFKSFCQLKEQQDRIKTGFKIAVRIVLETRLLLLGLCTNNI